MVIAHEQWTWFIFLLISIISRNGKSQMPMPMAMPGMYGMAPPPMYMPAPPMAVPGPPMAMPGPPIAMPGPPMPVFGMPPPPPPRPMVIRLALPPRTTTTTTTTQDPIQAQGGVLASAIAFPMPMPMPPQIGVPAMPPPEFCFGKPRNKGCPPCPPCQCSPSCTPSFYSYCSPCHKKCRCRSKDETPIPRPPNHPIPMPGSAFGMPFPPPSVPGFLPLYKNIKHRHIHEARESEETENSASDVLEDSPEESFRRVKRPRKSAKRKRRHFLRRGNRMDLSEEFVRPEIAYIARNGEVKISRRLSNAEAANLLGEGNFDMKNSTTEKPKDGSKVQVIAESNNGKSRLLVTQDKLNLENNPLNRKRMMKSEVQPEILGTGKKHLIFKPPPDKTISNISVSFMVT